MTVFDPVHGSLKVSSAADVDELKGFKYLFDPFIHIVRLSEELYETYGSYVICKP